MPLADGEVFAGYTILRLLGAGGMGEVYLAQHPRLPRREALKILPAALTGDAEFRTRFHREADIAATLWHPNIVAIHDRGEFDGQIWITMDYVEGTDASQLLKQRHPRGLAYDEAIAVVQSMAGALDHAHQQGLLHRDVKPANILLSAPASGERRVLLADFGIARQQDEISGLTATNMTMGSVTYAAPEQLTGDALDGRADQYALACTAFHLLAGDPPFDNSNPAVVIGKHLTATPPAASSRQQDLACYDDALARAMSKDPSQRFDSCGEFAAALARPAATRAHLPPASAPTTVATPTSPRQGAGPPVFVAGSAEPPPRPPSDTRPQWTTAAAPPPPPAAAGGNRAPLWAAAGVVAAVLLALVIFLVVRPSTDYVAGPGATTPSRPVTAIPTSMTAVGETDPPPPVVIERPPPPPAVVPGDLGLSIPMTRPACDHTGIVVLFNSVSPGRYASEIGNALGQYPGASYLRTDQACPSLRQVDDAGNAIYAIYRVAGSTESEVCAAVRAAGGGAYGKWLDTYTNPRASITC